MKEGSPKAELNPEQQLHLTATNRTITPARQCGLMSDACV